jgi:hypothetical protein
VRRIDGCGQGSSLVWFNPATRALQVVLPAVQHQWGVQEALPAFVQGSN